MLRLSLWTAIGIALALAASWTAGLRLNLTDSIPVGLYRQRRIEADAIVRGDLVLACLPGSVALFARTRGYVPHGNCPGKAMPVGKIVLATGGDTVAVTDSGLRVDGMLIPQTRPLGRDRRARLLPRLAVGRYVVARGTVWLGSRSPFGFDSRYFGAVPLHAVRATLRLVYTW